MKLLIAKNVGVVKLDVKCVSPIRQLFWSVLVFFFRFETKFGFKHALKSEAGNWSRKLKRYLEDTVWNKNGGKNYT